MTYVRKAVMFNMNDPHQRELFEFCTQQSANFSGFVKSVLFAYKNNRLVSETAEERPLPEQDDDDARYMNDLI